MEPRTRDPSPADYERWLAPVEGSLIRVISRLLRDENDADDALQDALERIWRQKDRLRNHPNPAALVLRIGLNAAYDILRRRVRSRRHETDGVSIESRTDPSLGAAERLEVQETCSEVLRAIARLPRNQALAIAMRFADGESYCEIAQVLGCSESTARTHVERGRARLARVLMIRIEGGTR